MIFLGKDSPLMIADRSNVHVTLSKEGKTFEQTVGSRFIMAIGSELDSENFSMKGNFAAVINGGFQLNGGIYLIIHTLGYTAVEQRFTLLPEAPSLGKNAYRNGSRSSLISCGGNDPCVDYLFFPATTKQVEHSYPDFCISLVVGGEGLATFSEDDKGPFVLKDETAFIIRRHEFHQIQTHKNPLGLLTFYPTGNGS